MHPRAHALVHAPVPRAHVIASLPGLRMLDTFEVEHYEGTAAVELLEQEDCYLAMMLHNACMVHKMVRGALDGAGRTVGARMRVRGTREGAEDGSRWCMGCTRRCVQPVLPVHGGRP